MNEQPTAGEFLEGILEASAGIHESATITDAVILHDIRDYEAYFVKDMLADLKENADGPDDLCKRYYSPLLKEAEALVAKHPEMLKLFADYDVRYERALLYVFSTINRDLCRKALTEFVRKQIRPLGILPIGYNPN